jgi:hypothetical protein
MARPGKRVPVEDARFYFTPKQDPFLDYPLAGQLEVIRTGETSRHTHDVKATDWASEWSSERSARRHIARLLTYLESEQNISGYTIDDVLNQLVLPKLSDPNI